MPTVDSSGVTSSGPLPIPGVTPLPGDAIPIPMPIAPGEPSPDGGRLRIIAGTDGDDRLVLEGRVAFGGDGNDTFVVTSTQADLEGPENLGTIMDFQAGDSLDLSQLGDKAAELGRTADAKGGQRVSIDYDGDGTEDGYLIVHERGEIAPDDTGVVSPPSDGEFHILPYPMPGDDGVVTILPYPMPGDGEVAILPGAFSLDESGVAGAPNPVMHTMSIDWIV
ncbi:MAG: hypothetical protein EPO51_20560 [Phenylobacterium sp.]|uniref:hypothetical protein n=1 Tax=Phenylobacterium sp. TaxID=1871053 RepID=UPI0012129701|nr:hypothetical protein [Phenylobacterium sp.]TAJ69917.1 MAG: hypothetical protein EPO51_20560 [Phenylobacterium sp.]